MVILDVQLNHNHPKKVDMDGSTTPTLSVGVIMEIHLLYEPLVLSRGDCTLLVLPVFGCIVAADKQIDNALNYGSRLIVDNSCAPIGTKNLIAKRGD